MLSWKFRLVPTPHPAEPEEEILNKLNVSGNKVVNGMQRGMRWMGIEMHASIPGNGNEPFLRH